MTFSCKIYTCTVILEVTGSALLADFSPIDHRLNIGSNGYTRQTVTKPTVASILNLLRSVFNVIIRKSLLLKIYPDKDHDHPQLKWPTFSQNSK